MNRASPPPGAARAPIPLGRDAAGRIIAIDCLRIRGRYSSAVTSRAGSRPCRRRQRSLFAAINANVRKSPFGGVGGRGTGCYRFDAGFRAFSHYRSVMAKPYWFEAPVKYPSVARLRRRLRAPAVQALPLDLLAPPRDRRPLRRRGRSRRFHDQVDLRPSRHRRVRALPRAAPRARWVRDHDGRRDGLAAAESDRLPHRRYAGANEPAEGDRSRRPLTASAWRRPSRCSCDRAAHHGVRASLRSRSRDTDGAWTSAEFPRSEPPASLRPGGPCGTSARRSVATRRRKRETTFRAFVGDGTRLYADAPTLDRNAIADLVKLYGDAADFLVDIFNMGAIPLFLRF